MLVYISSIHSNGVLSMDIHGGGMSVLLSLEPSVRLCDVKASYNVPGAEGSARTVQEAGPRCCWLCL